MSARVRFPGAGEPRADGIPPLHVQVVVLAVVDGAAAAAVAFEELAGDRLIEPCDFAPDVRLETGTRLLVLRHHPHAAELEQLAHGEGAQREVRMSVADMGDGGGEIRIALAQHLVHHRGRHPGPLEHAEGLARVHRAKLPRVADEHHARDVELPRDAKERLHLHGANHRRLVDGEHGACVRLPAPGEALGVGQAVKAGEEPLERAGLDTGPRASARTAADDGASPCIRGMPGSVAAARSIVVLPEPAWPCTPMSQSGARAMASTAAHWPRVAERLMVLAEHSFDAHDAPDAKVISVGPALIFERLWRETGCQQVVRKLLATRHHHFDVERAVFMTVLHRLMVSGSDRSALQWRRDQAIDGAEALKLQHLYRAMGWLGEALGQREPDAPSPRRVKDLIEEELFARRRDLFTRCYRPHRQ